MKLNLIEEGKQKKRKSIKTDYSLPQSKFKTVKDIINYHKKRQKGQGSFVTYSWDVGNMNYNQSLFNKMMGGDSEVSMGDTSTAEVGSDASVGMGEALLRESDTRVRKSIKPRPDVEKFLKQNVDMLDDHPDSFIFKAFDSGVLDCQDLSNLLRILERINIPLTQNVVERLGFNYKYIDYDTIGSEEDYINILEDLVKHVPNIYIDKTYWEGLVAEDVFNKLVDTFKYQTQMESCPEDYSSEIIGLRIECFVLGSGFSSVDRRIGINVIIETPGDLGVIELDAFPTILLDSLGYLTNLDEAKTYMDDYKTSIESALKQLR